VHCAVPVLSSLPSVAHIPARSLSAGGASFRALGVLSCLCSARLLSLTVCVPWQDCSFPAYFYTQPMATGPGFYDNLCPQSWQDGSAATFTLQDPHQQTFDCPGN